MESKTDNHVTEQDFLYIGDGADSSVKRFTLTGDFVGNFIEPGSGGLIGPRGLISNTACNLLVSNQKVDTDEYGNVLKYNVLTGRISELVHSNQIGAPFAPRGIILYDNVLFVADLIAPDNKSEGKVRVYGSTTGKFLENLHHSCFKGQFYPRSLVIGPDGLLYVSVRNIPDGNGGSVLRFDPKKGKFLDVFVQSNHINGLNRPEGLVFDPHGNLYITSFQRVLPDGTLDPLDTDKILIFNSKGKLLDKIDLYEIGQPRVFAQALLFGPNRKLFVPITGGADNATDVGSVRCYDVNNKKFHVLVPSTSAGGPLGSPWYLTFGNTNPATLAYDCDTIHNCDHLPY